MIVGMEVRRIMSNIMIATVDVALAAVAPVSPFVYLDKELTIFK